jgi:hypothetical protein
MNKNKIINKLKKTIMKQSKRIKIMLVAALGGLSVMGYAQGKVCNDKPYDIVSLQDPSDPSVYQWYEDNAEITGATSIGYTLPDNHAVGKFTYVRKSKKNECNDWLSSNAYTVEVLSCDVLGPGSGDGAKGVISDERDITIYKTVKI